jgi:segregation and condensation protein A
MHDKILDMLVKEEEITWQTIIFDLVKKEEMNPWDINITLLAQGFIKLVKTLKEMDFRISGRVILAAAILLRLKSSKLLDEDITELDKLIAMNETTEEEFYEELEAEMASGAILPNGERNNDFQLIPRTPQPRKRKISVYDLVDALNKALEVKDRREGKAPGEAPEVKAPKEHIDISIVIEDILHQIRKYYGEKQSQLTFSMLLPSESREDKVYTFIPLLHLTNQRKIDIDQEKHFGDIDIHLLEKKDPPALSN